MKKILLMSVVVLFVAACSAIVYAQPGRGPGGPGMGPGPGPGMGPGMGIGFLLQNDEIKSRLDLTEEQSKKLETIFNEARPARGERGVRREGGDRPQRPTEDQMREMRAQWEQRRMEIQKKIEGVLTAEQQTKAKELHFQISGGLESPILGVQTMETLGLSKDQIDKIRAIEEERGAEFRASMEQTRSNRPERGNASEEEMRAFFEKMRTEGEARSKKFSEKIQSVLTPDQKAKAEKLTAEGKELREKIGIPGPGMRRPGEGRRDGEGAYRPGNDSWRPGQGARGGEGNQRRRRSFPQSEE